MLEAVDHTLPANHFRILPIGSYCFGTMPFDSDFQWEGIVLLLCLDGEATIRISGQTYELYKNRLCCVMPLHVAELHPSDSFRVAAVAFTFDWPAGGYLYAISWIAVFAVLPTRASFTCSCDTVVGFFLARRSGLYVFISGCCSVAESSGKDCQRTLFLIACASLPTQGCFVLCGEDLFDSEISLSCSKAGHGANFIWLDYLFCYERRQTVVAGYRFECKWDCRSVRLFQFLILRALF